MRKAIAALLIISFLNSDLLAAAAGTTLFNFLKIPLNASQAATAGINALNIHSAGSNPAMIPFFDRTSLSASYAAYFQDTSFHSLSLTIPFKGDYHGVNIAYGGFDYGKMDAYLEDSAGDYVANGTFGASDAFFGASYGRRITNAIYAGAGVKYVRQKIDDSDISGTVLSAAAMYMSDETWYMSAGADNIGSAVDGYQMPSSFYISIADSPQELNSMFMYGVELRAFFDETVWLKGACEFNYEKKLFARLGYSCPLINNNSSLSESWYGRNLSAGFGIEYGFFSIDYAWLPFGDLGNTNMVSLQITF
ncbi:MAG: hypothetical protein FWG57_05165 [Endomicrobia bacterium]|nr:hypothetical protein [Endomicrobiia bacterium]